METHRKTNTNVSHLLCGPVLTILLSVAVVMNAQTTPTDQPRPIPAPVPQPSTPPPSGDNGVTQQELSNMNIFLGEHPELAEQLRKDPSLVDDQHFVADHPALQQFLQTHPDIRVAFRDHPNMFMHVEERFDQRADRITPQALANMDRFLDSHPEIAEQLRKDPSLIDNQHFVAEHSALQQFLQAHPDVRDEFRENPNAFMQAEDHYGRHDDARSDHDRDWNREMGGFGEFLRAHSACADALSQNPSLANNREFLETNPDLRDYLQAHPAVRQSLATDAQGVMTSPALAGAGIALPRKGMTTTPKPDDNMKPPQPR